MLRILLTAVFLLPFAIGSAVQANCGNGEEVCLEEAGATATAPPPIADTEPLPAEQSPAVDMAAEQQRLIEGISADLKSRRLMRPRGNNALNKVRRLREIMPDHDFSLNGERYIAKAYVALARRAMKLGETELAEQRLKSALKLDKQVPGKQALIEQIVAAQKADAVTAEKAPVSTRPEYRTAATTETAAVVPQKDDQQFIAPVMVAIPAGKFVMGSEAGAEDEKPMHEVTIEAFSMSRFEITLEQYRVYAVENQLPAPQYLPQDANRPVANVSWEDAQDYTRWLSERTGKSYRLATEAEWEYAARGGTVTPYYTGDDLQQAANCSGCGTEWDARQSAPVGSFAPNEFGLYDMHGNVWEWVQDCWTDNYFGRGDNAAAIVIKGCERHVLRGGSWLNTADYARVSYRGNEMSTYRHESIGFRVVHDGL